MSDRRRPPPLRRLAAGLAFALLAAAGGAGSGRAEPLVAVYDVSWAGLPAARIRLEFAKDGGRYRDAIQIGTLGLPHLVTRFRGTAAAEGSLAPGRPPQPDRYDAVYDLRKRKNSRISMRFLADGDATIAERGPGDTSRKPQLGLAYRRDAVDPLSALERIRQALRAAVQSGAHRFSVPVYDGARRFDVEGNVPARPENGRPAIEVALTLRPIAGFKGEASDDGNPGAAPRPARLTVSDDEKLLPLEVVLDVYSLPLLVRLDHLCPERRSCAF
jgi:hypothetical protein